MRKALWLLFALALPALAQDPVLPAVTAIHPVPTLGELSPPESLRPCCAFGYDLHVRAVGIPIPVYQIGNVLTLDSLGKHHYNDSALGAVKNLLGLSEEQNGLIYTRRGGFIDIAHVRDTADYTFYLFNRISPTLGQAGRIFYSEELGVRRVQLNALRRRRASGSAISWRPGSPGIWPSKSPSGMRSPSGMASSRCRGFLRRSPRFRRKISIPIYWAPGWRLTSSLAAMAGQWKRITRPWRRR